MSRESFADREWWRSGVLYQIYPRSFSDSNADGIGDLQGVIDRLDHFDWLGIDGIWLSPITVSPNADWGYDVADYCDVDPALGTLDDVDRLVAGASERGIRVLLDLVPNHASIKHPWFEQARSSRDNEYRDYFVWQDPRPDGSHPNNWVSSFGGPAWTFDDATGQWYLHNFLPEQADLNWWWNPKVADEFDRILRFWFDRGISGFRIDVCHMIVKDRLLRDNPAATEDDPFVMQMFGQRPTYNERQPEVHEVIRRWRKIGDSYDPPRLFVGETSVDRVEDLIPFYGAGDELQLAFNFPFIESPFEAAPLSAVVELISGLLPGYAWPVWTGSNHDVSRLATRWAEGHPQKTRVALMMVLTLKGTPVLYEGDEIGLEDLEVEQADLLDPVGIRFWPYYKGRDPERSPMPWEPGPNGGFSEPGVKTWLPMTDPGQCNVASQVPDRSSVLHLVRDLIALRRTTPDLATGSSLHVSAPDGCWVWRRGDSATVALNLSDAAVDLDGVSGRVAICTDRARDGEETAGPLHLDAWSGAIVLNG